VAADAMPDEVLKTVVDMLEAETVIGF